MLTARIITSSFFLFCMACRNSDAKQHAPVFQQVAVKDSIAEVVHEGEQAPNRISNPEYLLPFQHILLSGEGTNVINVLHIGDSHIKSGLYSQPFMSKLNGYYPSRYNNNVFFNFQWFCKTGTKYADYDELAELQEQLITSPPQLTIISLGTNDAFSGASAHNFYDQVDRMVKKIKALAPNTVLLITTPPAALKMNPHTGRYELFPALQQVVNTIIKYCNDHHIAYWNLYNIMGGPYSLNGMIRDKKAAPDRVHFTGKGYEQFAQWLFEAFTGTIK